MFLYTSALLQSPNTLTLRRMERDNGKFLESYVYWTISSVFAFSYIFIHRLYCLLSFITHASNIRSPTCSSYGPGSSVGIATELRAGRSRIESRLGRDFPSPQTGPGAYPASCKKGTVSFLGVKFGRGVLQNTHHLLVPRSWKIRAITLPILWVTPGLYRDQFTFTFTFLLL